MIDDNNLSHSHIPEELLLIPPLLAMSASTGMSLVTGALFALLLMAIAVSVSLIRHLVIWRLRILCLALIIATWSSLLDMTLLAEQFELRRMFGIYLPLLAVNSLVFTVSEDVYLRRSTGASMLHAARTGLLLILIVTVTGAIRELLAFGSVGAALQIAWPMIEPGSLPDAATILPIAATPTGAFLCAGLVFAAWKYWSGARHPRLIAHSEGT